MFRFPLIIYGLWLISEFILNRLLRAKGRGIENRDKNSLILIWSGIFIGVLLALYLIYFPNFKITTNPWIVYGGLALIVLGILFRFMVINSLGKLFTVERTIQVNHPLKTDGFYKYIRHPSYAASLLSFLGFGISLNNWLSLIAVFGIVFAVFVYQIKIEEESLMTHFGVDYDIYKHMTNRLIPFIY